MIAVTLYVRHEGAIGQFWTKSFQVPDGTPLEVLAAARQQCYAEKLEVGGVEHVARDPATVPAVVPGETVLQEGNPDIRGVVIRVGRSTVVEFRGKIGHGSHTWGFDDSYAVLAGPGGFECVLTEPEDRDWHRDGKAVVAELNRLRATVAELTAVCERTDAFMTRLMKAVPWGQTFDLDIAGLNAALLALPRAVAAGKQALGESS